ncbi:unnamed protein product [Lactuca virosa]|uniref:Uncharacterized protein n=1 Tax=Lactuca virosa TaxID=75947 RepID=A0AAU9M936_9ASTR|nr:unnamed protein product [Lactuca virosa]
MHSDYKLPTIEFIDPIISAEIPNIDEDPELYSLVNEFMIHDDDIDDVLDKPYVASSMFTAWMECNAVNVDARKLMYVEFPTKFVWQSGDRIWKPRKVGKCIGRIHSVSPKLGEGYFLRILLNKVEGPKSFEEIRAVNGEEYSSFRDACYSLGLLDDDKRIH